MDLDVLKTNLSGLERKILMLLNDQKSLRGEVETLRAENSQLRDGIRQREDQIGNFRNQIKITKIVDSINPDDGSVSELKKKVDEYIREIDKCIAHLSR